MAFLHDLRTSRKGNEIANVASLEQEYLYNAEEHEHE